MKMETNAVNIIEELHRATGRSTRRVDDYIQKLFEQGEIKINDHFDTRRAHDYLFDRVMSRLLFEHPNLEDCYLIRDKQERHIKIDLSKLHMNKKITAIFWGELTPAQVLREMKENPNLNLFSINL